MEPKKRPKIIIDAENAILGRLASYAVKQSLLGKEIAIVNAEKAIILGTEQSIMETYKIRRARGGSGLRGPFFPTTSERILKRTIRGMLTYKKGRGAEAFERIKAYNGIPKEFEEAPKIKSGKGGKGVTLKRVSQLLRGGLQ